MENAKIENLNAVCALLEEIDRFYNYINYEDRVRIKEAIKFIDSLAEPEPIDPHKCDLMVGDEVRYIGNSVGQNGKIMIVEDIQSVYYFDGYPFSISKSHGRYDLILIARNGAKIIQ
jgi:hypothetical protein